jgi:hypothetical protein
MSNPIKERPVDPIFAELAQIGVKPDGPLWEYFRTLVPSTDKTLTQKGEIQAKANVTGRAEQISLTLGNITAIGQLNNADNIAADGVTFARVNATAVTANNVDLSKAGVVNKTAANIAETSNLKWRSMAHSTTQPSGLTITASDSGGGSAAATFSAFTQQVPGLTSYPVASTFFLGLANATTYYCYINDPNFDGSGHAISVTTTPDTIFSNSALSYVGTVTTPAGGAGPTTGKAGGTGGGRNINTVLS